MPSVPGPAWNVNSTSSGVRTVKFRAKVPTTATSRIVERSSGVAHA